MCRVLLFIGCFLLASTHMLAIEPNALAEHFALLQTPVADSIKTAENAQLEAQLQQYMQEDAHFKADFTAIKNLGSVYANDGSLRILSWNYPLQNGSFAYSALLVKAPKGRNKAQVALFSCTEPVKPKEYDKYYANNWYGALYYNIFAYKNHYILLGYSKYSPDTQLKIIEVLDWSNDRPVLGKALFEKEGKTRSRIVFEYAPTVQMHINHLAEEKLLVFDHLSPEEPSLRGIYSYYGPDFSYDAYAFKRNHWQFIDDIDITNPK